MTSATFQLEDRKGPFWKQHKCEKTIIAADGHKYAYGKITSGTTSQFGYALHSLSCNCVLEHLAAEKAANIA